MADKPSKAERLYEVCGTYCVEASVLILVFGIFENYARGTLTRPLAIWASVLCFVLFLVGLGLHLKR